MAFKRKLDTSEDSYPANTKQIKLIPFPSAVDNDVAMSESPVYHFEANHIRLHSTASSVSSSSSSTSPVNTHMVDLYPEVNTDQVSSPYVGLLQPNGSMTSINHANCTQIPKLRMACSPGPHGQRTMFILCAECGSIEMSD